MSQFRSALYRGRVRHTRLGPFQHDFEYRVYYCLLDIDELDELDGRLRLFSLRRFNMYGFDPRDHGSSDGGPLRPWAEGILRQAGIEPENGRIELLAFPRVLGYVFNPISVWYCYDGDGDLIAVLHEVRNTFGDRHVYVVPIAGDESLRHSFRKELHVSPFNTMDQTYQFTISKPESRLFIAIDQRDAKGRMFRAGLRLTRMEMSDRHLLGLFLTHPLLTLKVTFGIHWQALRLWLKGATYHDRPEPAMDGITILAGSGVSE